MATQFKPTQAQILAAVNLFIAVAFVDTIKTEFGKIEQDILDQGSYRLAAKQLEAMQKRGGDELKELVPEGLVKSAKYSYMIEGLTEYCDDPTVDNDSAKYYRELSRRTYDAGFVHKENALAVAEHNVTKAEWAFMKQCDELTGMDSDKITKLEHRKKYLELSMKLFAHHVNIYPERERMQKAYFREHINYTQLASVQDELRKMQDFLAQPNF